MSSNVIPLTGRAPREWHDRHTNQAPAPVLSIGSCAVYTVIEVADILRLSRGSTYNLVRTGEIPALRLGGRWVVPKRRFHNWLDNLVDASTDDVEREPGRNPTRRYSRSS
jgi:excisionase family DNA binding protein